MKILTGKQMAEVDRWTIEELGIPGIVLMENAARSLCQEWVNYIENGEEDQNRGERTGIPGGSKTPGTPYKMNTAGIPGGTKTAGIPKGSKTVSPGGGSIAGIPEEDQIQGKIPNSLGGDKQVRKTKVLVVCGSGNNGGDGFAIARILSGWGYPVEVIHIGRKQTLKPDALLNYNILNKLNISLINIVDEEKIIQLEQQLSWSDWVVDALFGTGLDRPVRGVAGEVLKILKESGKKIVAVDIPSGINSDTGELMGEVPECELTVTFGAPKWGHFIFPGAEYIGKLIVADIGFPRQAFNQQEIKGELLTPELVSKWLPTRKKNAHKGSTGKLAIIGGSRHLTGAVMLSSRSALRTGAGYVALFIPNFIEPYIKTALPDIVTHSLIDQNGGFVNTSAVEGCLKMLEKYQVAGIGPGLGVEPYTREFVVDILSESKIPLVIDADGLNAIAQNENVERDGSVPWILTPHAGEAARLLRVDISEILKNPLDAVNKISCKYNAVVLLKGANTIIGGTDGTIYVNPTGNPGMAVLGMGDVLTGIITGLLAQGLSPLEAASAGAFIHGMAGDLAKKRVGDYGLIASDLPELIPEVMESLRMLTC